MRWGAIPSQVRILYPPLLQKKSAYARSASRNKANGEDYARRSKVAGILVVSGVECGNFMLISTSPLSGSIRSTFPRVPLWNQIFGLSGWLQLSVNSTIFPTVNPSLAIFCVGVFITRTRRAAAYAAFQVGLRVSEYPENQTKRESSCRQPCEE